MLAGKASRLQGLNELMVFTYESAGCIGEPRVSSGMILDLVDVFPQLRKISFEALVVSKDKNKHQNMRNNSNNGAVKNYQRPMQLTDLHISNLKSVPALAAVLRNLSWPSALTTLTVPDIPESNNLLRTVHQYCPNLKSFVLKGRSTSVMSPVDLNWFLGQYPDMTKLALIWCQVTDRDLEVISQTCADTQSLQKFTVSGRPRVLRRYPRLWSDDEDVDSRQAATAVNSAAATWWGFKMVLSTSGQLQELKFRYDVNLPIEAFEHSASSTSMAATTMTASVKMTSIWPCARTLRVLDLGNVVLLNKDENARFRRRLQDLIVLRQLCITGKGIKVEVPIDNREAVSVSEDENENQGTEGRRGGSEDDMALLMLPSLSQKEEPPYRYLCLEDVGIQLEEYMTVVELQRVLKAVPRLANFNVEGKIEEAAMRWLTHQGLSGLVSG
ncbi:hypothetical protein BGZ58_007994 [Dissophora ornata]|nr:hypothetical protein BGZ58_007994 [Dissophora ornata]